MDRRTLLAMGALAPLAAKAQAPAGEVFRLWPGTPPGGEGVTPAFQVREVPEYVGVGHILKGIAVPDLTVIRPERPDGSAALVIAGGSYICIVIDNEGTATARRLASSGVTTFVLRYRLPTEGWADRADVPMQDAQRAMRIIRANARRYGIDPQRIGVVGSSAGGHLAASLATRFAEKTYEPVDEMDREDARPAFAGLSYAVITMGVGTHGDSRHNLLGRHPTPAQIAAYSCDKRVTAETSPSFICVAADDELVPPMPNSMQMFDALLAARVRAELHVFQSGGHGFMMSPEPGKTTSVWPELFLRWGRSNGWFREV